MSLITAELLVQIVEGALLASGQPISIARMQDLFEEEERPTSAEIESALDRLTDDYQHRGIELKQVASGYRFQVREKLSPWVSKLWEERPPRYSRALLETLSIIAYQQPVTRGEIEDIRGVVVSTGIIRTLQDREWVQVVGYRDAPGRPAMYATTQTFLDYFNFSSLEELPPLAEVKSLAESELGLESDEASVLEGQYDLSRAVLESTDGSELNSAQEDIERAEAIVAQVEENLFKKKADQLEENLSSEPEISKVEENEVAGQQSSDDDPDTVEALGDIEVKVVEETSCKLNESVASEQLSESIEVEEEKSIGEREQQLTSDDGLQPFQPNESTTTSSFEALLNRLNESGPASQSSTPDPDDTDIHE